MAGLMQLHCSVPSSDEWLLRAKSQPAGFSARARCCNTAFGKGGSSRRSASLGAGTGVRQPLTSALGPKWTFIPTPSAALQLLQTGHSLRVLDFFRV